MDEKQVIPINMMVATRGGKDDGRTAFGIGGGTDPQFTLSAAHCHAVCYGVDLYNQTITGDVACSLTAAMDVAGHTGPKVLILNDQGGSFMSVTENITATLRAQEHGHPPIVTFERNRK